MSARSEEDRLAALYDLNLLDSPASESFDRITRLAALALGAPVAAISLTDSHRHWFKSAVGVTDGEIRRVGSPCGVVSDSGHFLQIPDLLADPRFVSGAWALAGLRFYAGVPLISREGHVLGAMCVLDRTPRAISADQVRSLQDMAALVMSQIELQNAVGRVNPLSKLANRHQMADDLDDLALLNPGHPYTALVIDMADPRHFDQLGRVLGTNYIDAVVRASSRAIRAVLGRATRLYHVGIVTYAALLDETTGPQWQEIVAALAERLREPIWCDGIPLIGGAVYGTSSFRLGQTTALDALRTAISAAHDARGSEAGYAAYNAISDEANRRRFVLLTDLRAALAAPDQFRLAYQPRLDLQSSQCVGVEALLRWQHPRFGNVPPGEFIPLAEQTALAHPVTAWVIDAALRQALVWRGRRLNLRISVNVSAPNLEKPGFADAIAAALARHGVPAYCLEVELTESALIRDGALVRVQLRQIRDMGVEVAIDDFGTGYSTFSYLKQLPANTVKIDQSFIVGLAASPRDRMLVRSMVGMAHELGYRVVAEGVETQEALDFLATTVCDEVQGYFISRPVSAEALEAWLRETGRQATPLLASLDGN